MGLAWVKNNLSANEGGHYSEWEVYQGYQGQMDRLRLRRLSTLVDDLNGLVPMVLQYRASKSLCLYDDLDNHETMDAGYSESLRGLAHYRTGMSYLKSLKSLSLYGLVCVNGLLHLDNKDNLKKILPGVANPDDPW